MPVVTGPGPADEAARRRHRQPYAGQRGERLVHHLFDPLGGPELSARLSKSSCAFPMIDNAAWVCASFPVRRWFSARNRSISAWSAGRCCRSDVLSARSSPARQPASRVAAHQILVKERVRPRVTYQWVQDRCGRHRACSGCGDDTGAVAMAEVDSGQKVRSTPGCVAGGTVHKVHTTVSATVERSETLPLCLMNNVAG